MLKFINISIEDFALLEKFLASAGNSLETFRYFSKRKIDSIKNHKYTLLLIDENENPVAYGHLDYEDEIVWLGNCVAEKFRGKGLGQLVMRKLLNFARAQKITCIRLSVDRANTEAIRLYKKFGFKQIEEKEKFSFYEWQLFENPEILISTLAFSGKNSNEIISAAKSENLGIEFSSGLPYDENMESVFLNAPLIKYAHNYFPAPKEAFVLNLASNDESIRRKSIEHCIKGIFLSHEIGARFFSAHAGFCIDPSPSELGNPLTQRLIENRNKNWELFISSLKEIFQRTFWTNAQFLIENNVLAKMNLYEDGTNPLFCCDAEEMNRLINEMNEPRLGILLDTGHLKVSSKTLNFNIEEEYQKVKENIFGVHHSDNDGNFDTNEIFKDDYWFLKHMKEHAQLTHVIEVRKTNLIEIRGMIKLLQLSVI
ncbi:MAG: GNAT family N-acetyltransferase [Bacteroidota bacterium]